MYAFRVFKPRIIHFFHIIWITPTQEWFWGSWWSISLAMWKYPSGYILLFQKLNAMPFQRSHKQLQMTHVCLLDRRSTSINKDKNKLNQKKPMNCRRISTSQWKLRFMARALQQSSGLGKELSSGERPLHDWLRSYTYSSRSIGDGHPHINRFPSQLL